MAARERFYLSGIEGMRPPSFDGEENGREGRAVVTVVVVQSGESSVSEEKQRTGHDIPYASLATHHTFLPQQQAIPFKPRPNPRK